MSSQSIERQTVAFCDELKIRLTGLEKHLDLPSFSIDPDDLFFRNVLVCADKGDPVLPVFLVADTDDLCRYLPVFTNKDVYRKQISAAPGTLLTNAKDLFDGKLFSFVLVIDTRTLLELFLIMAMESSPRSLTAIS